MFYKKNLFVYLLLFFVFSCDKTPVEPTQENNLKGHWIGKGNIIVSWCNKDFLDIDITISDKGLVSGVIGDAKIDSGKVTTNPMGDRPYLIKAYLSGDIVKDENIKRDYIKIIFEEKDNKLLGGAHTSGSKFGGKDKMMLSVSDMVLMKK